MTSIQRYDAWPQEWPFEAEDGDLVTYEDHRKIVEELEAKLSKSEALLAKAVEAEQEKALQELSDIGQEMEKSDKAHEAKVDEWWDSITTEERELAFYSICKRIYEAELQDGGTYRHALYDVFGFDGGMYRHGMNCGFMAIHNAIGDGEDYQAMRGINRLEVIDENGRALVKYLDKDEKVRYDLQDDNRTLKVFIDKVEIKGWTPNDKIQKGCSKI